MKRILAYAVLVLLVSTIVGPTLAQNSDGVGEWSTRSKVEKISGQKVWIAFVQNISDGTVLSTIRDWNTNVLVVSLAAPRRMARASLMLKVDNNPPIDMSSWPFKFGVDGMSTLVQLDPVQELRVLSELRRGRRVRVRYLDASEETIETSFTLKGSAAALRVVEKGAE